jgi:polysaccharide export outer membrane protein
MFMASNSPQIINRPLAGLLAFAALALLLLGPAPSLLAQASSAPAARSSSSAQDNYVLAATDRVLVKVFQEDDLQTDTRVSNDGTIVMPLIGSVHVGGSTVGEAAQEIQRRLHHGFLVSPQVTVTVSEFSKRRFTVMGQVQKGGTYLFPDQGTLDLLQAIGMAGGYTRIADRGRITVQRSSGGNSQTFRLNAKAMSEGKDKHFEVQPDDTITVGETWF